MPVNAMTFYPVRNDSFSLFTERAVALAIEEDCGRGDVTSEATIPEHVQGEAFFLCKHQTPAVLAGQPLVELIARHFGLSFEVQQRDGARLTSGERFGRIQGSIRSILSAERVSLNILQRASGIATYTREFVDAISGTSAQICDTRKTDPCWRELSKYAVRIGGGVNHRHALDDMFLIKNNHIDSVGGDVREAIRRCRTLRPELKVECEVRDQRELDLALEEKPDGILLDNFNLTDLRVAVNYVRERNPAIQLEYSGGARFETIRAIAECGVDYISVGALTHSYPNIDISLRMNTSS